MWRQVILDEVDGIEHTEFRVLLQNFLYLGVQASPLRLVQGVCNHLDAEPPCVEFLSDGCSVLKGQVPHKPLGLVRDETLDQKGVIEHNCRDNNKNEYGYRDTETKGKNRPVFSQAKNIYLHDGSSNSLKATDAH